MRMERDLGVVGELGLSGSGISTRSRQSHGYSHLMSPEHCQRLWWI